MPYKRFHFGEGGSRSCSELELYNQTRANMISLSYYRSACYETFAFSPSHSSSFQILTHYPRFFSRVYKAVIDIFSIITTITTTYLLTTLGTFIGALAAVQVRTAQSALVVAVLTANLEHHFGVSSFAEIFHT